MFLDKWVIIYNKVDEERHPTNYLDLFAGDSFVSFAIIRD